MKERAKHESRIVSKHLCFNFIQKLIMFEYLEKIELSFENISEEGGHTVKIAEKEITDGRLIDLFHLAKQKGVDIHTDVPKWISKIYYIQIDINSNALMSRIYRTL